MPDHREKNRGLHRIGSRVTSGSDMGFERAILICKPCFCDPHEVRPLPGPFPLQKAITDAVLDLCQGKIQLHFDDAPASRLAGMPRCGCPQLAAASRRNAVDPDA